MSWCLFENFMSELNGLRSENVKLVTLLQKCNQMSYQNLNLFIVFGFVAAIADPKISQYTLIMPIILCFGRGRSKNYGKTQIVTWLESLALAMRTGIPSISRFWYLRIWIFAVYDQPICLAFYLKSECNSIWYWQFQVQKLDFSGW